MPAFPVRLHILRHRLTRQKYSHTGLLSLPSTIQALRVQEILRIGQPAASVVAKTCC